MNTRLILCKSALQICILWLTPSSLDVCMRARTHACVYVGAHAFLRACVTRVRQCVYVYTSVCVRLTALQILPTVITPCLAVCMFPFA